MEGRRREERLDVSGGYGEKERRGREEGKE